MKIGEPTWWYDEPASVWPRLLAPVASVYGALAARRMAAASRYRSRLPVVCVGNFTAGGTGKTPMVAAVVRFLSAQGHRPVVLSRGYGGRVREPQWVRSGDTAAIVGDEPLELAASCAVLVSPDRVAGAQAIESQPIGGAIFSGMKATVIVMDDGLQNPALAKDLVISVVDATRGFGNGRCIPAGPLRAPLTTQLPRVDAIVLNAGASPTTATARPLDTFRGPVLAARIEPSGEMSWLEGQAVVAFAGIGVPARFERTLRVLGADVREMISFPDHHAFSVADAVRLMATAADRGARLVTTRKDAVRLAGYSTGPLADLRQRLRALDVSLAFDPAGEATLAALLAQRVPVRH